MHSSQHKTNNLNYGTDLKVFFTIEIYLKLSHGSEKKKKTFVAPIQLWIKENMELVTCYMHHITGMIIVNFLQILLFCVGELFLICKLQSEVILICYCTVDIPHFFFSHPFFVFIIKEKIINKIKEYTTVIKII